MAPSNTSKIPIGTVLAGKYRVTREIGRGGMAAVYEAENIDIGKRVAVKVLAAELTSSTVVVERFLREARAAAAISSPYICDVYDSGRLEDGRPFLVLELLEGESLYERMTRVRQIDFETTVRVVTHVARGLTKAHAASIVHRDLKPENIFLTTNEDGALVAKILDFGLAKFYAPVAEDGEQVRLTREGAVFGTPAYMSPEQVKGQGGVDHRADLWALGCMTYECLTGRTVWSTEQGVAMTFAQIASAPLPDATLFRPDLPPEFTTWFHKALERSADDRFQTAKELAEDLALVFEASPAIPVALDSMRGAMASPSAMSSVDALLAQSRASGDAPTERPPPVDPDASQPLLLSQLRPVAPSVESATSSTLDRKETPQAAPGPSRVGTVLATLVVVGALGAGGLFGYRHYLQKPPPPGPAGLASVAPPPGSTAAPTLPAPQDTTGVEPAALKGPKWVPIVASAQDKLAGNDLPGAVKLLKEAFDAGGASVPRVLMEHAQIAAVAKGPCRLGGLSRPRPAALSTIVGRTTIAVTPKGAVVAWTDDHESPGHDHVYATKLDAAMHATTARDVTPEGVLAAHPQLVASGDKIALVYEETKGNEAGVLARWLDGEGRIAGPVVPVSAHRSALFFPAGARAADGSFWIGWEDERQQDSGDLYLRHLTPGLDVDGPEVRATDYVKRGARPRARIPSLAVGGSSLYVVYRFEREPQHVISRLRVPLADPTLAKGLEAVAPGPPRDRELGEVKLVNTDGSKADAPQIACGGDACFLVWQGEAGGTWAALMEPSQGQILWRKKFDARGSHPTVSVSATGAGELAWYSGGRVMLASIGREGIGPTTAIGRVTGDQPRPTLAAGSAAGEWYLAWLDFETGHLEAFAARAVCR